MKKMTAPIVIAILLLVGFFAALIGIFLAPGLSLIFRIVLIFLILTFICVTIFVLMERLNEIRSGVEDDLSQY